MMRIALIGFGAMGKMVEQAALARGHSIVDRVTRSQKGINLDKADLFIDFSAPDAVLENVKRFSSYQKHLLIGTTGWESDLEQVKKIVKQTDCSLLYSPNFSLGIHIFLKILKHVSLIMKEAPEYDKTGIEVHHQQKKDAPSGTALAIQTIIKDLSFTSVRVGSIAGIHRLIFDSPFDTITFEHSAKSKEGFALGAIMAAEWLIGKKGFFTLDDYLNQE